jgi:2-polyprenyl-3-methyl-5-hydroxy-6-metoxy-1,4-benzoquinol methylase
MKLETERDVFEWVYAAKALAVVSAWNGVGLFERLRGGPLAMSEFPIDARALATTLPVLANVGLIALSGDRVGLTPTAERLLATGQMPTERNLENLGDLSRMADVLREGGPVRDAKGDRKVTKGGTSENPEATQRFMDMLYRMSEEASASTFTWLAPTLPARGRVLDLGGGHGRYARVFADAGHEVTLFDQPMVTAIARKRHGDVLRYIDGDFHTVESFGGPYDLILLANIVHGEGDAQNASLIARAAKSLAPGGRVAVRDMFIDELGGDPPPAVYFGLTMLFYTEHGRSPTITDTKAWFQRAGLVEPTVIRLETHQLVCARKLA